MLRKRVLVVFAATCVMFGLATSVKAQLNRGVIEGVVTDPQGAFVPGVKVTITSVETAVSSVAVTNSAGYYHVVDLVPSTYHAHFVSKGFMGVDVSDIEVVAGSVVRVDARLKLGEARQEVQVTAASSLVETSPTNASTTLSTRLVQAIPLEGGDLQELAYLIPGVNPVLGPPGTNFGFNSEYGSFPDPTHVLGSDLSVNGGQPGDNAWYLDGNLNLVGFAENEAVNPSPDAVEEFQVVTDALAPEYGRTGGGVFNVVLKSGTNAVHGEVYEYNRNSAFNARDPFTSINALGKIIPQGLVNYNDFGGTIGGPVVLPHIYNGRNKTFFFFSWDTSILHQGGNLTFNVPTAAMREGDFSEDPNVVSGGLWNPYSTVGPNSSGEFERTAFGTPVAGNPYGAQGCTNFAVESGASTCNFSTRIPSNMLDPTAMFFVKSFPMPNYLDPLSTCPLANSGTYKICSNYLGPVGSSLDNDNISLKIDEAWSAKSRYFVEWLFSPGKYNNYQVPWTGPTFPQDSTGFGSNYPTNFANQDIAIGNTYTLGPSLINQFRASFTRQYISTTPTHPFPNNITDQTQVQQVLAPLKIPVQSPYPSPNWAMSTPGGQSLSFGPTSWVDMITTAEAYTILDNVTKVVGRHTLKTGFVYRLEHSAYESGYPTVFSFQGGLVQDPNTGLGASGLAQFMLGAVPNDGTGAAGLTTSPYERWGSWGFYGQDEFHITPRFTLTYGLRYDIMGMFSVRQYPLSNFCLTCANSQTGLLGEMIYEGQPGWPGGGSAIGPPNYNDFAPRINFAWSPFANNSTVIRGGYDVFYTDAANQINAPGQGAVNDPGWSDAFAWTNSFYPNQCDLAGSGQCVAFPLSSTVDKGSLASPPYNPILPAPQRPTLYGVTGIDPFTPPETDPMVQMWNFEIQRELPGGLMASVGYVGSHGTHLAGSDWNWNYVPAADLLKYQNTINSVVPITQVYSGNTANMLAQVYGSSTLPLSQLLKPYPFYDALGNHGLHTFASFNGTSSYNGLDIKVQKHTSHGLDFLAAYTASKTLVNPMVTVASRELVDPFHWTRTGIIGGRAGSLAYSGGIGASYQNPDDLAVDRSVWAFDIPQTFNLAGTYQLPFGAGRAFMNRRGVLNTLLGGWLLNGTFNAEAGPPLYVSGPCDTLQSWTMQIGCRVDVIGNPHFSGNRTQAQRIAQWINPAAFQPSVGGDQSFWANPVSSDPRNWQWGTEGPLLPNVRAPGFWNLDASLEKQFHVTESKYFDFRWTAFNALNHQNLGSPNTTYCLPPLPNGNTDLVHQAGCTFGQIFDVATDPRSMEFALKFYW
jgi:hypothetical protein